MTRMPSPFDEDVPIARADQALFLDFDGTLAPLQDDPDTVALPSDGAELLMALNTRLDGALALISGRGAKDLSSRTPNGLWRVGAHGLEICRPDEPANHARAPFPPELMAQLETLVSAHDGVRIEEKGRVAAIHYRQNPEIGGELFGQLSDLVADSKSYRLQHGKMVIELKPDGANKGVALKALCAAPPFQDRIPVMIGDDATDEDAIRAAKDLGGYGIKVGDGPTCASYRLKDPEAVWRWIRKVVNEHA